MEDLVKELDADADKFVLEAGITVGMVEMKKLVMKVNSFKQFMKVKKKKKKFMNLRLLLKRWRWNSVHTISDSSLLCLLLILLCRLV